jgi:hypothetical protein
MKQVEGSPAAQQQLATLGHPELVEHSGQTIDALQYRRAKAACASQSLLVATVRVRGQPARWLQVG